MVTVMMSFDQGVLDCRVGLFSWGAVLWLGELSPGLISSSVGSLLVVSLVVGSWSLAKVLVSWQESVGSVPIKVIEEGSGWSVCNISVILEPHSGLLPLQLHMSP